MSTREEAKGPRSTEGPGRKVPTPSNSSGSALRNNSTPREAPAIAEEALTWARREGAAEALRPLRDLFSGGPDTSCRTTWPKVAGEAAECVEVPMADLREAFDRADAIERGE